MEIKKVTVQIGHSDEELDQLKGVIGFMSELDVVSCLSAIGVILEKQSKTTGMEFDTMCQGLMKCRKEVLADVAKAKKHRHHHRHHHRTEKPETDQKSAE